MSIGGGRGLYQMAHGDFPTAVFRQVRPVVQQQAECLETMREDTGTIGQTSFTAVTWNACGLEEGAINDVVAHLESDRIWDAVFIQEGPNNSKERFAIVDGGHAIYVGISADWERSIMILIHRRWVDAGAKLVFHVLDKRIAFLDLDSGDLHLRLICAHLPHSEYHDDIYESALCCLEEIVLSGRRERRMNVLGMDANAMIGAKLDADSSNIVGEFGHGVRNTRGATLASWMHGVNLAAVSSMFDRPWTDS